MEFSKKEKALIHFGKILNAKEHFIYLKEKHKNNYKEAKKDLDENKSCILNEDLNELFRYDLMNNFNSAKNYCLVESFEKHYKKLKHEFKEQFPEFEDYLKELEK